MTDTMHAAPQSANGELPKAQEVARAFVVSLHSSLRAVRLYPLENAAVRNALTELDRSTSQVMAAFGSCELRAMGDYLFVNETRLRLQLEHYAAVAHVLGRMRNAGVGGLVLSARPDVRSWMALLAALLRQFDEVPEEERVSHLLTHLQTAGVTCFDIEESTDEEPEDLDDDDDLERARQTFVQSVSATRDLFTGARIGRSPAIKRVKRAVQGIVDCVMEDPTSIIGLTTLREFDEYTFVHSVNVCILSVALGRRVGLSKIQLLELGLAALMHDIGKSRLPLEVLNKHGRLEGDELRIVQSHSWRGVLALLAMQGSASRSWRAMAVAHEHHMKVDLSGYPRCVRPRRLSLFSRIVAIADGFDAATSLRVYQENPWTPADVVRGMRDNPKLGLDPVLVKAFINLTGIYPVGTVVTLDTHEIGVVMAAGTEASALARPGVRIVFDAMGNRLENGPVVDLTAKGPDGQFVRSIIRTEDPDRHGIRVSDYFA